MRIKPIILILLLLIFSTTCFAGSDAIKAVIARRNASAAGFCDAGCAGDVNLCWTPDSTTADCSDGDTSASAISDVTIAGGKIVVTDALDCYSFDTQIGGAPEIGDPTVGSIEFKVNISVWVNTASMFKITNDGYIKIIMGGTSDTDIEATIRALGGTESISGTSAGNKGENVDLRIRAMWRETGTPNTWIEICNADGTSCANDGTPDDTDYDATTVDGENVEFGNEAGDAAAYTMWDIKVYSTWQGWDS